MMAKDSRCFGCDGCLNALLETVALFTLFVGTIGATVLPLIAP